MANHGHSGSAMHVDGYPAEWTWVPAGRTTDGGLHRMSRCRVHGLEFETGLGNCDGCVHDRGTQPMRPDGLECPDYWIAARYGVEARACLFCEHHREYFGIDRACRQCLDEDGIPYIIEPWEKGQGAA